MNDALAMKEKRITLVHDRFQAECPECCGLISSHMRKSDAVHAAKGHTCRPTRVWDAMAHDPNKSCVWSSK